jgi:type IV pilus assembly protein PilN
MISFNLLPWREELAKEAKQIFIRQAILAVILGLTLGGAGYFSVSMMVQSQVDKNDRLKAANADAEKKIAEIRDLRDQIKVLTERKKVVEGLQNNRNQATRIMEQLGTLLPEGASLTDVVQKGPKIKITGIALNQSLVATTMTAFDTSEWLSDPILVQIKAIDAKTPGGAVVTASEFILEIKYTNPDEVVLPGLKSRLTPAQQVSQKLEEAKAQKP